MPSRTGQDTVAEITAAVFEGSDGNLTPPVVEIYAPTLELRSPAEVAAFISAVREAAAVAFPDDPVPRRRWKVP